MLTLCKNCGHNVYNKQKITSKISLVTFGNLPIRTLMIHTFSSFGDRSRHKWRPWETEGVFIAMQTMPAVNCILLAAHEWSISHPPVPPLHSFQLTVDSASYSVHMAQSRMINISATHKLQKPNYQVTLITSLALLRAVCEIIIYCR